MKKFDYTQFKNVPEEVAKSYLEELEMHIKYVQEAGGQLGVPEEQLAIHDQSKFSPEEFPYYALRHGGMIDVDGFDRAWLHHIHANPHHWQHWMFTQDYRAKGSDVFKGCVPIPRNFMLEMLADWMGSSRAYTGEWNMMKWLSTNLPRIRLHPKTTTALYAELDNMGYADAIAGNSCWWSMQFYDEWNDEWKSW